MGFNFRVSLVDVVSCTYNWPAVSMVIWAWALKSRRPCFYIFRTWLSWKPLLCLINKIGIIDQKAQIHSSTVR